MKSMRWLIVLVSMTLMSHVTSGAAITESARDVGVQINVLDIHEIDSVREKFTVDLYLLLRWRDSALAHDGIDSIERPLSEIWHPKIQLLKQQNASFSFSEYAEVTPEGDVYYRQRMWGAVSNPLDLRHFPFDHQAIRLTLVDSGYGNSLANFVVDSNSGISSDLAIPDWELTGWNVSSEQVDVGVANVVLPGVVFELHVDRHSSYYLIKVILPLILIVMMSWLVFWIDPEQSSTQISVAVTAMLTLIAYRFSIGALVPKLGFLTSLDYFILASTVLVFLSLIEVVYTANLQRNKKIGRARMLDAWFRWLAPALYVFLVLETLYLRKVT